jgi:hypothetical protein
MTQFGGRAEQDLRNCRSRDRLGSWIRPTPRKTTARSCRPRATRRTGRTPRPVPERDPVHPRPQIPGQPAQRGHRNIRAQPLPLRIGQISTSHTHSPTNQTAGRALQHPAHQTLESIFNSAWQCAVIAAGDGDRAALQHCARHLGEPPIDPLDALSGAGGDCVDKDTDPACPGHSHFCDTSN